MTLEVTARMRVPGVAALAALCMGAVVAGCSGPAKPSASGPSEAAAPAVVETDQPARTVAPSIAPLKHRVRADILVTAPKSLSRHMVHRLDRLHTTAAAVTIDVGTVRLEGHKVNAVAVNPSSFRRFAPEGTAESNAVWETVARGEAVVAHATAKKLNLQLAGPVVVAPADRSAAQTLRLGALATTIPDADLVVSRSVARNLGLHEATGVLLSAGKSDPASLASAVRHVVGKTAQIDLLSPPTVNPTAFLTGSSAAAAFGAFSYRYFPDGTIQPDASWVAANIRTETVPILGTVTCHRLTFRQLRGALAEIVARGLANKIHRSDGCYVPRFIERNPNRSISLHTWGIAIDIDAAANALHTAGSMDPRVVAIFKKWGFVWGGDWANPRDPMHFQLGALLH